MVPPITNLNWKELVLGRKQVQFQLLATKILMGRILISTKQDQSPANLTKCINEVHDFFVKNEKIAQTDLNQIFR